MRNGVRSIEHGDYLDDEAIAMMLERGTWLVPTLMANRGVLTAAEQGISFPLHMLEKARVLIEQQTRSVRRAIAAGVRIAFGTDSGVTAHGRNLEELELLHACGMIPASALRAATLSAAELMVLDSELGSIEPGKCADLGHPAAYQPVIVVSHLVTGVNGLLMARAEHALPPCACLALGWHGKDRRRRPTEATLSWYSVVRTAMIGA